MLRSSDVKQAKVPVGREGLSLPRPSLMTVLALVPTTLILGLLGIIIFVSFREDVVTGTITLRHYLELYTDPFVYSAFLNTIGFTLVAVVVSMFFGVPAAWLVERTNVKGKSFVFAAMILGMLIPGFFVAMGWLFMFHPKIGIVNQVLVNLFGLSDPLFNIASVSGMGWVQGLSLAPVVFIMTSASFRTMDVALEEAAQASGATFLTQMRTITIPLAFPSLLAATLYVLTIGIAAFDVPAIIGLTNRIYTFSTYLYIETHPENGLPRYGAPAAFSTFMIVVGVILSWWYSRILKQARKYQVITGKNYKPKLIDLRHWQAPALMFLVGYFLLAKIIPLLLLLWAALIPYLQVPSVEALKFVSLDNFRNLPWPLVKRGISNTAVLMVAAPTLALTFSLILSWVILRTRTRFRFAFDYIAFLPHAVPNIIFGVAALVITLFVFRGVVDLYGTVLLLVIIVAIVQISFATRITNSALIQIHPELEEVGYVSGAGTFGVLRRIIIPLLRPTFLYGWLWLAMMSFRELTLPTILFSPDNITLSVAIWSLWYGGNLGVAAALTIAMIAALLPLTLIYWWLGGGGRAIGPQ